MNAFKSALVLFESWIERVTNSVVRLHDSVSKPHTIELTERTSGEFAVTANPHPVGDGTGGSDRVVVLSRDSVNNAVLSDFEHSDLDAVRGCHVKLSLHPDRFLFRPLDLPRAAEEFLTGIVRSQIDRLTPWNPADAVFGWSKPMPSADDRISLVVAATALTRIRPELDRLISSGAHSVGVFTSLPDAPTNDSPIKLWDVRGPSALDVGRVRKALIVALCAVGVSTGLSLTANWTVGAMFATEASELSQQVAQLRGGGSLNAKRMVTRRKHDASPVVMTLDALSQILPDHTYLVEFRLDANKLRLIGITRDAPSLIGLLEQSGRFSGATFFAPTTRSSSEPGERFHIEVTVKPLQSARS
jgi:general secretion pathway protein L